MKSFKQILSETSEQYKEPSHEDSARQYIVKAMNDMAEKMREKKFTTIVDHVKTIKSLIDKHTDEAVSSYKKAKSPEEPENGSRETLMSSHEDHNAAAKVYTDHLHAIIESPTLHPTDEQHPEDSRYMHAIVDAYHTWGPGAAQRHNRRVRPDDTQMIAPQLSAWWPHRGSNDSNEGVRRLGDIRMLLTPPSVWRDLNRGV